MIQSSGRSPVDTRRKAVNLTSVLQNGIVFQVSHRQTLLVENRERTRASQLQAGLIHGKLTALDEANH